MSKIKYNASKKTNEKNIPTVCNVSTVSNAYSKDECTNNKS